MTECKSEVESERVAAAAVPADAVRREESQTAACPAYRRNLGCTLVPAAAALGGLVANYSSGCTRPISPAPGPEYVALADAAVGQTQAGSFAVVLEGTAVAAEVTWRMVQAKQGYTLRYLGQQLSA